jgi:multicomponent Na+:H+ antiporter subunit F
MTTTELLHHATTVALLLLIVAILLSVARLVRGPTLSDRILALDTMNTLGIGLIAVFAIRTGVGLYLDIAIALGLVGFLSTAALARYLLQRAGREAPES